MLFEQQEIHNDGKEQIDVSNDYSRLGPMMFPGREHKVEAQYVIVAIPFTGDKALFDCKPAMFSTNHLQGEIEGEEVHFKFSGTPITEEELKAIGNADQHSKAECHDGNFTISSYDGT